MALARPRDGVTVLTLSDRAAWEAAYAEDGLPSHSWNYAWGLAAAGYDPRLAIVEADGARMLLPFFERAWGEHVDIATIPCLSGARLSRDSLAPLELWADHARRQGWVCGYIQLAIGNIGLQRQAPDIIMAHNVLFEFDLDTWDIRTAVQSKSRQYIKTGDRMGAELILDKERLLGPFLDLHYRAMDRLGATMVFPPACVERWFEDEEAVAFGAAIDGRVEAVHLSRMHARHAEQHLAAMAEAGRPLNSWLIWRATDYFRSRGVRHFNFGGYRRSGDGVHWMKRRFNAHEFPLLSVRQVYDRAAFEALCRQAGDALAPERFPPYRVGSAGAK